MAKAHSINVANPAGNSAPRLGDDYIRELALAVVEALEVDHYLGATSPYNEDAAGQHVKVKFHTATSATTVASGTLFALLDTVGSPLAYKDFSGTVCVLTSGTSVLLDGADLTPEASINSSGSPLATACPAASGSHLILSAGTELEDGSDPASGTMAIATTKYVDDQIDVISVMDPVISAAGSGVSSTTVSVTLANGLIIKFCSATYVSGQTWTATFATPFPNACFRAVATAVGAASNGYNIAQTSKSVSAVSFIWNGTTSYTFDIIAIGW